MAEVVDGHASLYKYDDDDAMSAKMSKYNFFVFLLHNETMSLLDSMERTVGVTGGAPVGFHRGQKYDGFPRLMDQATTAKGAMKGMDWTQTSIETPGMAE